MAPCKDFLSSSTVATGLALALAWLLLLWPFAQRCPNARPWWGERVRGGDGGLCDRGRVVGRRGRCSVLRRCPPQAAARVSAARTRSAWPEPSALSGLIPQWIPQRLSVDTSRQVVSNAGRLFPESHRQPGRTGDWWRQILRGFDSLQPQRTKPTTYSARQSLSPRRVRRT